MENLDLTAALMAQDVIAKCRSQKCEPEKTENLITKTAGVVQENGIYAVLLFLFTRSDKHDQKVAGAIAETLIAKARDIASRQDDLRSNTARLVFLAEHICANQARLRLTKQTWEQALIYARYGAKAWKNELK